MNGLPQRQILNPIAQSSIYLRGGGWVLQLRHICKSKAVAGQLKTITIQTSISNTAVNMEKLTLRKQLKIARHSQSRHPRSHATFGKIFRTKQKIYNEIVHWKPILLTKKENEVAFKIADAINIILTKTLKDENKWQPWPIWS